MGTPDFAAAILRRVTEWPGGRVVAAYCQPDRPSGRGHKLQAPEVKTLAASLGIPVFQPLNFKEEADRQALAALTPDVLVVAAYGLILPQSVLDIPRLGPFNVHASLLPRHRGAAPIQRAIMEGDTLTGVSIMRMERGLDTGPVAAQRALGIDLADTADKLSAELADLGGRLMVEELERMAAGTPSTLVAQDNARATYAAKLAKADGRIVWDAPAYGIHALIRGVTPWPGAQTLFLAPDREPLPLLLTPGMPGEALPIAEGAAQKRPAPGSILGLVDDRLAVACSDNVYLLSELKPAGSRPMSASAFWNGYCRTGGQTTELRLISPPSGANDSGASNPEASKQS